MISSFTATRSNILKIDQCRVGWRRIPSAGSKVLSFIEFVSWISEHPDVVLSHSDSHFISLPVKYSHQNVVHPRKIPGRSLTIVFQCLCSFTAVFAFEFVEQLLPKRSSLKCQRLRPYPRSSKSTLESSGILRISMRYTIDSCVKLYTFQRKKTWNPCSKVMSRNTMGVHQMGSYRLLKRIWWFPCADLQWETVRCCCFQCFLRSFWKKPHG
jgi:hypothetical protein